MNTVWIINSDSTDMRHRPRILAWKFDNLEYDFGQVALSRAILPFKIGVEIRSGKINVYVQVKYFH